MKTGSKKSSFGLVMAVYLLGIFMGAIDTGIVTPARTVIQNNLMVDEKTGIWMITIYTLAYAASIPVMGKLADKFGRKYIYLTSIFLFGAGSLFCGLSQSFGSFTVLLLARAVQAIGGGGIVPVATAEFGTTFPPEKRGMALGLVGGVYGIANIFGASAGSAILDLFGKDNWQFIFYVNVPITLFILIAGFLSLPNTKMEQVKKIDFGGILILTGMVLSLLYGLRNIDFFDFGPSFTGTSVYPFLIIFLLLLPLFLLVEKHADDPVINLSYFYNIRIVIILLLSFVTGFILMGMIFVPQFSENALKVSSGSGGYFVIILGLFAGLGAPLSGKMIDKLGVKIVLFVGFGASILGSLFLILVTANYPGIITVVISLILIGVGIGFTIGTPLNYMMLDNTKKEESNSALAALSLIRSIGTAIAPAIMVGFIAHAGTAVQANVMTLFPTEVTLPALPYAKELTEEFNKLKADSSMKDKLKNVTLPDLASMETIDINMNSSDSDFKMSPELLELLESSDVTNITENSKTLSKAIFSAMLPGIMEKIQSGIDSGIQGLNSGLTEIDKNSSDMQSALDGIDQGIAGMESALASQKQALEQLQSIKNFLTGAVSADPKKESALNIPVMLPPAVKSKIPESVLKELGDIKTFYDLESKITELNTAVGTLTSKLEESKNSRKEMASALEGMASAKKEISDTLSKMTELENALPSAFETAQTNYLAEIDNRKSAIEEEFQKTLNGGFKQVYMTVVIASAAALLILLFYKENRKTL